MIITGFSSLQACTDRSTVWCFQKVTGEVVYQIHAHSETISGTSEGGRLLRERHYLVSTPPTDLSLSCYVPGLLVTAGTDDTVKFWDVHVSETLLPPSVTELRMLQSSEVK